MAHVSFLVWITLLAWPPCFFGVLHPPHLRFLYSIGPQPKALGSCGRRCASTSRVEAQEAGSSLGQNWSFTAEWNFRNVQRYYLIIHSMFMLEKDRIRMHADMYTDNVTYTDTNTLYITISEISIYHMVYTYYISLGFQVYDKRGFGWNRSEGGLGTLLLRGGVWPPKPGSGWFWLWDNTSGHFMIYQTEKKHMIIYMMIRSSIMNTYVVLKKCHFNGSYSPNTNLVL